jgi:hypothetical protein
LKKEKKKLDTANKISHPQPLLFRRSSFSPFPSPLCAMASTTFAFARGGLATGTSRRTGTALLSSSSSAAKFAPVAARQSRRSGPVAVRAGRGQPLMPPR